MEGCSPAGLVRGTPLNSETRNLKESGKFKAAVRKKLVIYLVNTYETDGGNLLKLRRLFVSFFLSILGRNLTSAQRDLNRIIPKTEIAANGAAEGVKKRLSRSVRGA